MDVQFDENVAKRVSIGVIALSVALTIFLAIHWFRSYRFTCNSGATSVEMRGNQVVVRDWSVISELGGAYIGCSSLLITDASVGDGYRSQPRWTFRSISTPNSPTSEYPFVVRPSKLESAFGFQIISLSWNSGVGPTKRVAVIAPYWLLVVIATAPTLLAGRRALRRRRRLRRGKCLRCGYDLRFSPDKCPECGARVAIWRLSLTNARGPT